MTKPVTIGIVGGCIISVDFPETTRDKRLVGKASVLCKSDTQLKYILSLINSTGAALTRAMNQLHATPTIVTTVTTPTVVCTYQESYKTKFEITDSHGEVLTLESDSITCAYDESTVV